MPKYTQKPEVTAKYYLACDNLVKQGKPVSADRIVRQSGSSNRSAALRATRDFKQAFNSDGTPKVN